MSNNPIERSGLVTANAQPDQHQIELARKNTQPESVNPYNIKLSTPESANLVNHQPLFIINDRNTNANERPKVMGAFNGVKIVVPKIEDDAVDAVRLVDFKAKVARDLMRQRMRYFGNAFLQSPVSGYSAGQAVQLKGLDTMFVNRCMPGDLLKVDVPLAANDKSLPFHGEADQAATNGFDPKKLTLVVKVADNDAPAKRLLRTAYMYTADPKWTESMNKYTASPEAASWERATIQLTDAQLTTGLVVVNELLKLGLLALPTDPAATLAGVLNPGAAAAIVDTASAAFNVAMSSEAGYVLPGGPATLAERKKQNIAYTALLGGAIRLTPNVPVGDKARAMPGAAPLRNRLMQAVLSGALPSHYRETSFGVYTGLPVPAAGVAAPAAAAARSARLAALTANPPIGVYAAASAGMTQEVDPTKLVGAMWAQQENALLKMGSAFAAAMAEDRRLHVGRAMTGSSPKHATRQAVVLMNVGH